MQGVPGDDLVVMLLDCRVSGRPLHFLTPIPSPARRARFLQACYLGWMRLCLGFVMLRSWAYPTMGAGAVPPQRLPCAQVSLACEYSFAITAFGVKHTFVLSFHLLRSVSLMASELRGDCCFVPSLLFVSTMIQHCQPKGRAVAPSNAKARRVVVTNLEALWMLPGFAPMLPVAQSRFPGRLPEQPASCG